MLFIFLVIQNRVIGMVLVATQTTGNILVFELSDNMSSETHALKFDKYLWVLCQCGG